MAEKPEEPKAKARKKERGIFYRYKIKEGKLERLLPFCPRCGRGVFMADHGDFWSCGKCGDRLNKQKHFLSFQSKNRKRDIGKDAL